MKPRYYEFYSPVKILSGYQALENIPHEFRERNVARPLLITDKGVVHAGLIAHIKNVFKDSGAVIAAEYSDVPPDSSVSILKQAADMYTGNSCDSILAVGGGSVIDTAKGVNILISEGVDDISERAGVDRITAQLRPCIVVPTTSGTGSEVTSVAVIADHERGIKLLFGSNRLMPDVAVLDPRMTLTLPPVITAATGMDALTHAIEAYTCLQKNPMSDAYALEAVMLVSLNIRTAVNDGKNVEARLALSNASCMAGIAFSNSLVGVVHSLGHSLGAVCRIPHGTAMSIFLPVGLLYNFEAVKSALAELLLPLAGADIYVSTSPDERAMRSIKEIRRLKDDLFTMCGLPRNLKEAGVSRDSFPEIAEKTLGDGSLILNPVDVDKKDALSLLEQAFED